MATINVPADYSTIQAAVNAASSGDTILIANGTYTITSPITRVITNLTIKAANPVTYGPGADTTGVWHVIVNNTGTGYAFEPYTGWEISDIQINGSASDYAISGAGGPRQFNVKRVQFNSNYGGIRQITTGSYVQGCLFAAISPGNCVNAGTAGMWIDGCVSGFGTRTNAAFVNSGSGGKITNCTSLMETSSYTFHSETVSNCISYDDVASAACIRAASSSNMHTNNVYGASTHYTDGTTNWSTIGDNISANPDFTDLMNFDITLAAGSPCIHAGTSTGSTVDYQQLAWDSPISMGAFRYEAPTPPTNHTKSIVRIALGFSTFWRRALPLNQA